MALNSTYRILLTFVKSCILSCKSKFDNIKKFHCAIFEYALKPIIKGVRVFLAGYTVTMVTKCVTKMVTTCFPMTGQLFDTMIVASVDKELSYNDA